MESDVAFVVKTSSEIFSTKAVSKQTTSFNYELSVLDCHYLNELEQIEVRGPVVRDSWAGDLVVVVLGL